MQENGFWDDIKRAEEVTKESKRIKDKVSRHDDFVRRVEDIDVLYELMEEDDEESAQEIISEVRELEKELYQYKIEILLSGEYDGNDAILTLHAGVGGSDANDWTEMLLRMYTRWCEKKGYKVETLDLLEGDEAGIKSVTLRVKGENAYGYLKAEKGVHRLVRISPFNANGKRQTSFASLEVLPELTKEQDIDIKSDDLKIDTYRSSGAGGQHVNTTDSAVRITHLPTGLVVTSQDGRSQIKNKEAAMKVLASKLYEMEYEKQRKEVESERRSQVGSGDRSEKIRTYNFPQGRVTDHRIKLTLHRLEAVLDGDLDEMIDALIAYDQAEMLKAVGDNE